jgi:Bacterial Ig domain/Cellulase (glycosyl hydrolase family 5)
MKRITLRALAALLACLAVPAAAHAAPTAAINVPGAAGAAGGIPAAAKTGAKYARVFMFYDQFLDGAGQVDSGKLGLYDDVAKAAQDNGMKLLFVVTGGQNHPPASNAVYADAVAAVAKHMAQAFPGVVGAWEIWNEQDEAKFWGKSGGDPAIYADLLRQTYPKVKAADPGAQVVMGGLTGNDYAFLDQVYAAGGGGSFDVVSAHTDTACNVDGPDFYYRDTQNGGRIGQYTFLGVKEMRASMNAHGDNGKPIWLTEMGWSSSNAVCDTGKWAGQKKGGVTEQQQAQFLSQAYHCLAAHADANVAMAFWFSFRDENASGSPETTFGLTRADGSQKPSYNAFVDYLAHGDKLTGGCGDFDAPAVTIRQPTANALFTGALPIEVSATDSSGVGRVSLYIDGQAKVIRNFTDQKLPTTLGGSLDWQGAKQLALGQHTLKVVALDRQGNQGQATVTVTKVDPSKLKAVTSLTSLALGGKGRTRTIRINVNGAKTINKVGGKVTVFFDKRVKGTWRTAHKYTKPAKRPIVLKVKLEKAKWRVRASFTGSPGYKKSASKTMVFTVR